MKAIKRFIKKTLQDKNVLPYKVVKLKTGISCQHYRNGLIEVI